MRSFLALSAISLIAAPVATTAQGQILPYVGIDAMYSEPIDPISLLCKRPWTIDRAVLPSSSEKKKAPPTKLNFASDVLFLPNGTCRFQSGEVGTWTCRPYARGKVTVGVHVDPSAPVETKKKLRLSQPNDRSIQANPLDLENQRRKAAQLKKASEAAPGSTRFEEAEGMVELEIEVMEDVNRRRRKARPTAKGEGENEEDTGMGPVVVYNIPLGRGLLNPTVARFGRGTIHWLPRPDALKSAAIGECRFGIARGVFPRKIDRVWARGRPSYNFGRSAVRK